jgi:hypothetical protein
MDEIRLDTFRALLERHYELACWCPGDVPSLLSSGSMWSQTPAGRLDVKKGFSEEQIIGFLREGDRGVPVPVLVDGGVRRGPDVFKALALVRRRSESDGPKPGAWRPLATKASKPFLPFTTESSV